MNSIKITLASVNPFVNSNSKKIKLIIAMYLSIASWSLFAQDTDKWVPVKGAETLNSLISRASEIKIDKNLIQSKYNEDGSVTINAWGETFERTWEIQGDDRICYSYSNITECFVFEENATNPNQYRTKNVDKEQWTYFTIDQKEAGLTIREGNPTSEGGLATPSAQEIAEELTNPNNTMGMMTINFDYVSFDGSLTDASSQSSSVLTFQPNLPYPINETTNLYVRPAIPVVLSQDVPSPNGGFSTTGVNLGNISMDAFIGKMTPKKYVIGGGVVGTFPTRTDPSLGLNQWLLGPELLLAKNFEWGAIGALITHQWRVGGNDPNPTSVTGGQYFYTVNLKKGWRINGAPVYSYNHQTEDWTFPIAAGVSKTTMIAGRPWNLNMQYMHYFESPDVFGPKHQLRLVISPIVKLPW